MRHIFISRRLCRADLRVLVLGRAIVVATGGRVLLNSHITKSHCKVELQLLFSSKVERGQDIRQLGFELAPGGRVRIFPDLHLVVLPLVARWQPFLEGACVLFREPHDRGP
jgi:hypothetical protein